MLDVALHWGEHEFGVTQTLWLPAFLYERSDIRDVREITCCLLCCVLCQPPPRRGLQTVFTACNEIFLRDEWINQEHVNMFPISAEESAKYIFSIAIGNRQNLTLCDIDRQAVQSVAPHH